MSTNVKQLLQGPLITGGSDWDVGPRIRVPQSVFLVCCNDSPVNYTNTQYIQKAIASESILSASNECVPKFQSFIIITSSHRVWVINAKIHLPAPVLQENQAGESMGS